MKKDNRYTWSFSDGAYKKFRKLDIVAQKQIVKWLESHIENSDNVRQWGKKLEGNLQTFWRYRVGKYRILAEIKDKEFMVLIVKTDKRNDVYKNKR
jgi:mRNA interferase RelE/StbE